MSLPYPKALADAIGSRPTFTITISKMPAFSVWERQHQSMFGAQELPKKVVVRHTDNAVHVECFTQKQSFTSNHLPSSLDEVLTELWGLNFGQWLVQTPSDDVHILQNKGKVSVRRQAATKSSFQKEHNRKKNHVLDTAEDRVLLDAFGMVAPDGALLTAHVHKFKQINHLLGILLQDCHQHAYTIVDAGCGKAYMSIALAYALQQRGKQVQLIGIDSNWYVVDAAAQMSAKAGISDSVFIASDISTAALPPLTHKHTLLVALHACNTATDDAIALGVTLSADVMYVAPCCHHHIQQQLTAASAPEAIRWMLDDGIIKERLADLLTDTLRRDVLRAFNYDAHIQEFVASEHTAKNLLIRAVKHQRQADASVTEQRISAVQHHAAIAGVRPVLFDLLRLPSSDTFL